jgi:uncharacterized protein involved in outer membrane biogenesis
MQPKSTVGETLPVGPVAPGRAVIVWPGNVPSRPAAGRLARLPWPAPPVRRRQARLARAARFVAKVPGVAIRFVAAALVASAIAISPADLTRFVNHHKDLIAAQLTRVTGRTLRIDGAIGLDLGRVTTLRVTDARLANAPWGSRPDLARVRSLAAEVALPPLLLGRLQVRRLTLTGADIVVETDRQGRGNWPFAMDAAATEEGAKPRLQMTDLALRDTRLVWRNGRTGENWTLKVKRAALSAPSPTAPVQVDMVGRWRSPPFRLAGELGTMAALAAGDPVPVALKGRIAGHAVRLAGTAAGPPAGRGFALDIAVQGKDLRSLASLAGLSLPSIGPVAIKAKARGKPGRFVLDNLRLVLGAHRLTGRLSVRTAAGRRPRLEGALRAARLDLTDWARRWIEESSVTPADGGRLFPDRPLPLADLKATDLRLVLHAGTVRLPWTVLSDVDLAVVLDDGALTMAPMHAHLVGGAIDGALSLTPGTRQPTVAMRLSASGLDVRQVIDLAGVRERLEGTAELDLELGGRGRTLAAIMAGLDGQARLLVRHVRDHSGTFDKLNHELGRAFDVLLGSGPALAALDCVAGEFEIRDGVVRTRATVARPEGLMFAGDGQIDLGAERLDFRLAPQANVSTYHGGRPIKVRGPFVDPRFHPAFAVNGATKAPENLCLRPARRDRDPGDRRLRQFAFAPEFQSDALAHVKSGLTAEVQRQLFALGYDPGPIDGVAGPLTRKAIRKYQADHRHPVEDRVSQSLLRRLWATRGHDKAS